jgi:hypothetical protein
MQAYDRDCGQRDTALAASAFHTVFREGRPVQLGRKERRPKKSVQVAIICRNMRGALAADAKARITELERIVRRRRADNGAIGTGVGLNTRLCAMTRQPVRMRRVRRETR